MCGSMGCQTHDRLACDFCSQQQLFGGPTHDHINGSQTFPTAHDIFRFCISHQHVVLPPIPGISISCPMKNKPALLHEFGNLFPCGWSAEKDGLARHNARPSTDAVDPMHPPIKTKNLNRETDAFEVFCLCGKAGWSEGTSTLAGMSSLDRATVLRKPNLVLRATRLSEAIRKCHRTHSRTFHQRFQRGRLEAVSLPAASNTFTCFSQASRVTGDCSRTIRAKRSRSASRMVSIGTAS